MLVNQEHKKIIEERFNEVRKIAHNREASGTAHANLYYVEVKENEEIMVEVALDTADTKHQKEVIVNEMNFMNKNGDVCQLSEVIEDSRNIIAFLDEGTEPTEHLLNEMIVARKQYLELKPHVILVVSKDGDLDNPTLQKTLETLPFIEVFV